MNEKWHIRFLELARFISTWSKDPSTKVGCVIAKENKIISIGYNGFAQGVQDDPHLSRNEKLMKTIHAEENAILFSKQDLEGCILYVYPFDPCSTCVAKIIQSGIKTIFVGYEKEIPHETLERWKDLIIIGQNQCLQAKIKLEYRILK